MKEKYQAYDFFCVSPEEGLTGLKAALFTGLEWHEGE